MQVESQLDFPPKIHYHLWQNNYIALDVRPYYVSFKVVPSGETKLGCSEIFVANLHQSFALQQNSHGTPNPIQNEDGIFVKTRIDSTYC